jgi:hypothetical protein
VGVRVAIGGHCAAGQRATRFATTSIPAFPVAGDFNGDGKTDLLLYGPGTRADRLWYGTATGFRAGPAVTINGEYFPVPGDFNGDGKTDILWYEIEHPEVSNIWYGAASGFTNGPTVGGPSNATQDLVLPLPADFDGDGRTDLLWVNFFGSGPTTVWYGSANATVGFRPTHATVPLPSCGGFGSLTTAATTNTDIIVECALLAPDFNGDGRADLLYYESGSLADQLWYSNGTGFTAGPAISVNGFYFPTGGDFNGDGKADVLWYASGPAADYLWYGRASGFRQASMTVNGDYDPVIGDFNGDGKADIVWYAPGPGRDYLRYGATSLFRNGPYIGINGNYFAITADFNGDGNTDILWYPYRGGNAHIWYGKLSGFRNGTPIAL